MAGAAYDTSAITQSTKTGYVTYDIYTYQVTGQYCSGGYDPDTGACLGWSDTYGFVYSGQGSTGAKVDGTVNATGKVIAQGHPIAFVGSTTSETWVASPPVPSNTSSTEYRNVSPGTSGSGSGSVTGGNSSRVFAGGQSVAIIGSQVTTSVGNTTTIQTGSSKVFIGG